MRLMVAWLRPIALAIPRVLQCVAPRGVLSSVRTTAGDANHDTTIYDLLFFHFYRRYELLRVLIHNGGRNCQHSGFQHVGESNQPCRHCRSIGNGDDRGDARNQFHKSGHTVML